MNDGNAPRTRERAARWPSGRGRLGLIGGVVLVLSAVIAGLLLSGGQADHRRTLAVSAQRTVFRPHSYGEREVEGSSHYCDGCKPPLRYKRGQVIADGVDVHPIYWIPPAGAQPFPTGYGAIINRYIANVAAADRANTDVFSIDHEYYEMLNGKRVQLRSRIIAGAPLIDTDPLPANGCTPAAGAINGHLQSCVTDQQLDRELESFLSRMDLPTGMANFYPVFFPPGVETTDGDGGTSGNTYCGYHSYTETTPIILYSNEPYIVNCGGGQAPNGVLSADTAIDTLSHELNETITDPVTNAWTDSAGDEIGDICAEDYGEPLGSTNPAQAQSTEYNQVINGGHYYTQTEFSNYAYARYGGGYGCQHSEAGARTGSVQASEPIDLHEEAYPTTLPADGRSSASVYLAVSAAGRPAARHRITFTTRTLNGDGECGRVRSSEGTTDRSGVARNTYIASSSSLSCEITATDALTGRSVSAIVYQGSARAQAPVASAGFPRRVRAGRVARFTVTLRNNSSSALNDAQLVFDAFGSSHRSPRVSSDQLTLAYALNGGRFRRLSLDGGTDSSGGSIRGVIGGADGFTIPAHATATVSFRMKVARDVPVRPRVPLLSLEAYLYQVNPATSSAAVLADSSATDVSVR